jgi:hypothetical protein
MKKIKLFEAYSQEIYEKELVDFLYEKLDEKMSTEYFPIYEDDEEEVNLTSGERAAMARDNQIISKPQLAALYLKALGRAEGEDGAYLVMIDGIKDFGEFDKNNRAFTITNPAFADAIGLESSATITRTVNKFVNLINGVGETQGEVIYPKIYAAYEKFSSMNPVQISNLAAESIQDSKEYTVNRDKAVASLERSAVARVERSKKEDLLGAKVYSLINSLKSASSIFQQPGRAQKTAIAKIAAENGESEIKLKEYYKKYLISRNIFNSTNFYDK